MDEVLLTATKAALDALSPLNADQARRALRSLAAFLGIDEDEIPTAGPKKVPALAPEQEFNGQADVRPPVLDPVAQATTPLPPKAFLAQKKPTANAERVAVLAFYLSEYRGMARFKTADIVALNMEAAQSKLTNAARDLDNAERSSGYLTTAGDGFRQLSARGEALVGALPSRADVKVALSEHPVRRRKATSKKGGAAGDVAGAEAGPKRSTTRAAKTEKPSEKLPEA